MIKFITQPFKSLSAIIAQSSNALSYVIIGIIVVLGPLFFIPVRGLNVTAGKGYLIAIFAIFALLVAGITVLKRGALALPKHAIFIVLGALSLTTLIGALFSQSSRVALIGYGFETSTWLFVTFFGLFALLSYKTIKSYDRIGLIYGGLFLSFIVLALLHIIRFIAGPAFANLGVLGSATATLVGSWSDLGIFAGVVLLISIVTLQLAGLVRFAKWFTGTLAVVATVFLLVMNMYTIWVVLGFMSLLIILYLFAFAYWDSSSKTYKKEKRVPWYVLALFVASLVGIFLGGMINMLASGHQNISWSEIRPSLTTTATIAKKSIAHNFATGYGPNSFALGWSMIKPVALSGTPASEADFAFGFSYITSQMVMNGLLGIVAWLAFAGILVFTVLRRMSKGFESALERYFVVSLAGVIFFLLTMSLVVVPGSYLLVLFAIVVGAFYGVFIPQKEASFSFIKDPRTSFFGILAITLVIIGTLIGGYIVIRKAVSFVYDTRGLMLIANGKNREAVQKIGQAAAYASHDLYHIQLAQLALSEAGTVIAGLNESNRQTVTSQAEQVLGIALGNAKAALAYNSLSYKNWILLGNVYRTAVSLGVKDAYALGLSAYQEAEKRNPSDSSMKLAYANLAIANKDTAAALGYIKESIDMYPIRDAYLLRAQIQIGQEKWSEVVTSLKQAVLMDQSNAPLYVYLAVAYEKSGDINNANQIYDLIRKRFTDGDEAINQIKKSFSQNQTVTEPETEITPVSTPKSTPVAPKPKK